MSRPNFSQRELEVLAFWEKNEIFKKSLQKPSPKGSFVFFEGPPTANGRPGIHHVEARAFKDIIPRFRTMQGYHVDRQAGWDTHGLPVELEVEKQFGFTGKKDIEAFGIEKFNAECKKSVWKYLEDWKAITKRIGFWVDLQHPYITYEPRYIEALWGIVKQIWDKGLLYKDYRVTPHCPRCGTSLSSHELAQGYKDVKDLSVYAKFKVVGEENTFFVAWTTTPWTLPGNVALAVGADIDYVKVQVADEFLWLAKARLSEVVKGEYEIVEETKGAGLVEKKYQSLFPFLGDVLARPGCPAYKTVYTVVAADFVSVDEGSGIVHTAVMYGQDDFELGQKAGLPKQHVVKLDGTFMEGMDFLSGRLVTDEQVAVDIIKDLAHRGLLLAKEKYEHSYPHCWRCKSKIIYYAKDSWYIRMSSLREELLAANETIAWEPEHIKEGRFGEWLREVKDWAFSRERYWGTPLPIWECEECDHKTCIGSFAELKALVLSDLSDPFDPHRPFVDELQMNCAKCNGTMRRVKEVCDVWFDSGAMPFASGATGFPADYISEAIDQTRGWFYTLLAVSTLLGKGAPYKHVICLGHLLDKDGKKMSKSLGNIVDPNEMIEKYSADAVRWYMYTITSPGDSKRFDEKTLNEMVQNVFMMLWNVKAFYELYAASSPRDGALSLVDKPHVLDRWVLASLGLLVEETTRNLERYAVTEAAREIGEFITDLSTWYVRRSRDRMKTGDGVAVLHEVLVTLSKLMAPFTPFFAEALYQDLNGEKKSVHLEDWPVRNTKLGDVVEGLKLVEKMEYLFLAVSQALKQRANAGINVRQVLSKATIRSIGDITFEFQELFKEEVNVKEVIIEVVSTVAESGVELDTTLTPELKREGFVREMIRAANAARKNVGLTIEDRIVLTIMSSNEQVNEAVEEHRDTLLEGTRADEVRLEPGAVSPFELRIEKK